MTALNYPSYELLYKFTHFNPVQVSSEFLREQLGYCFTDFTSIFYVATDDSKSNHNVIKFLVMCDVSILLGAQSAQCIQQ